MSKNWLQRLWGTMEEPRKVTTLMVVAYAVAVVAGVTMAVYPTPHPLPYSDGVLRTLGALTLGLGGLMGAPSAWLGRWWVESGAATACLGGMVLALFEVLVLVWPGSPGPPLQAPVVTIAAVLFSILFFATRRQRVRRQPYAPGKGPDTPEIQSDVLLARIIADEQRRGQGA